MSANESIDCFVSVVTIVQNQGAAIEPFVRQVQAILAGRFHDYEILLIDCRSDDDTVPRVDRLLHEVSGIRFIRLSANVHPDVAWSAGCENAIGDFVVLMSLQDPPGLIVPAVRQCREGSDVVVGAAPQAASLPYRLLRPLLSHVLKRFLAYNLPRDATEFRCLSRRAVNSVTEGRCARYRFPLQIMRTGYPSSSIAYRRQGGKERRRQLRHGFCDAMRLLVFNSTAPLRYMSGVGILGSTLAFMGALYSLVVRLFKHNTVEGWTSIVLLFSGLFCLMFIILAFFGEYLGRILGESTEREYHVVFERNSSVMVCDDRLNVLRESESISINAVQTGRAA